MPGTRMFFIGSVLLAGLVILLTFGPLLQSQEVSDSASAGYSVWRDFGCEGCHTLYGQGAPYAPDLTQIYDQRGGEYLREFLVNPNAFHPDQRPMPRFNLMAGEVDSLLAFLQGVGDRSDAVGWPPRPIRVSGGDVLLSVAAGSGGGDSDQISLPADPVARGEILFSRAPALCSSCHSRQPGAVIIGPSLAGIADRAASRVPGQSAEEYIRNSIVNPGAFVVEGFPDSMARNLAEQLNSSQIDDLIAFLLTLREA